MSSLPFFLSCSGVTYSIALSAVTERTAAAEVQDCRDHPNSW